MFRKMIAPAFLALTVALSNAAAAQPPQVKGNVSKVQPNVNVAAGADLKLPDLGKLLQPNVTLAAGSVKVNEAAKTVTVTVKNTGKSTLKNIGVRATVDAKYPLTNVLTNGMDKTSVVDELAPGQSKIVVYQFDLAGFRNQLNKDIIGEGSPTFLIKGVADPSGKIAETNEGDNSQQISKQ